MAWLEVPFGRYRGKTLPQIVLLDPDWFFWACEEETFKSPKLRNQAKEILKKATRIKIPDGPDFVVEYVVHPEAGKIDCINMVPSDHPTHDGASPTYRRCFFDMSLPRRIAPYDKAGGRIVIDALKRHVFGGISTRLTRKKCEEFFDNPENFV